MYIYFFKADYVLYPYILSSFVSRKFAYNFTDFPVFKEHTYPSKSKNFHTEI